MTIAFPTDERVLLLKISRGDQLAFRELYDQTSPQLYAVALRLLRRRDVAEDVVQEVFLTLWHAADQYDMARGSVRTWLSTITRNRCIDRLRRAPIPISEVEADELPDQYADDPLQSALTDADLSVLAECLEDLNEQQRRSISLAYFDGLTHQDVAARMDVPLGSAKTWIRRGLDVLRKCMGAAV